MKQTRWVSQCVMHGDRRPFPVALVTLDEEEIVPWAEQQGIEDRSIGLARRTSKVRALIQGEVDRINEKYAQVEQVKKFVILDHDLSQETGELTPTLKVKRNIVNEKYAGLFDELYTLEREVSAVRTGYPGVPCAPTRLTTAACSSAADPAPRRSAIATRPKRKLGTAPRRWTRCSARAILAVMILVAGSFWGPIPMAWLWIGGQIKYHADSVSPVDRRRVPRDAAHAAGGLSAAQAPRPVLDPRAPRRGLRPAQGHDRPGVRRRGHHRRHRVHDLVPAHRRARAAIAPSG